MDKLESIGPIDGRYRRRSEPLSGFFSEKALMEYRIRVEGEYLIFLSEHQGIDVRSFSEKEKAFVRGMYNLSLEDARIIKQIEFGGHSTIKPTNHDVKAVEYYMKEKLRSSSLEDCLEWVHFALTSEDVNNLAYGSMVNDALDWIIKSQLAPLYDKLCEMSSGYKSVPMLARTHGQSASPTTFGKECKVYASRLKRQIDQLSAREILVKLNGASGNYNAHHVAYPDVDWTQFTTEFIGKLNPNLSPNLITTQIEPHDSLSEIFDNIARINTIIIDLNQDMWRYISDNWLIQKPVEDEVGSSTMPHKVNPIDFENSEGNLGVANALFKHFSSKFSISRLQRDLSDSTVKRNLGIAFGHSSIGYQSALKGLNKVVLNESRITEELESHPEIISEAIQTVLRREGTDMPYEKLKQLTRGRRVTMDDFKRFIDDLDISEEIKDELRQITPTNYVGISQHLI